MERGNRPTQELRIPCEGTYTFYGVGDPDITIPNSPFKAMIPCPALAGGQSVYFHGNDLTPEVHFWCEHHLDTIKTGNDDQGWLATCLFEELE